jgi:hypothetical protein
MDFQDVCLAEVGLAKAPLTCLLFEPSGFPWGQQRTPPEPGAPVGPVPLAWGPAAWDLDVPDKLRCTMAAQLFAFRGCQDPVSVLDDPAGLAHLPSYAPGPSYLCGPGAEWPVPHGIRLLERYCCGTGAVIVAPAHALGLALAASRALGLVPHVSDAPAELLQMAGQFVLFGLEQGLALPFGGSSVLSTVETEDVASRLMSCMAAPGRHWPGFRRLAVPSPVAAPGGTVLCRFLSDTERLVSNPKVISIPDERARCWCSLPCAMGGLCCPVAACS